MFFSRTRIRWLGPCDYPHVLRIERLAYGRADGDVAALARTLAVRGTAGLVAERSGERVGYVIFRIYPEQRRVSVADLAVHPEHRRQGVARCLLEAVLERAAALPAFQVVAAVEESLLPAQLFLRAMGFRCHRTVKGGLDGADAYVFHYEPV
jgi:ribosomal protein S18 acetylase RimI-like enzyme